MSASIVLRALNDFGTGYGGFAFLKPQELGVDYAQGYHIARPQPID